MMMGSMPGGTPSETNRLFDTQGQILDEIKSSRSGR
jgi:hypothetical protein